MKRFQKDDLAITCNSRAPLVNDGHLVRILEVLGPKPDWDMAFAYYIERVDGQPFTLARWTDSPMPVAGTLQLVADHSKLRPLSDRLQEVSSESVDKAQV